MFVPKAVFLKCSPSSADEFFGSFGYTLLAFDIRRAPNGSKRVRITASWPKARKLEADQKHKHALTRGPPTRTRAGALHQEGRPAVKHLTPFAAEALVQRYKLGSRSRATPPRPPSLLYF